MTSEEDRLAPRKKKIRNNESPPRLMVVGGGIAGVCCAQELARLFSDLAITLVAMGDVLKESSSVMKITNCLEEISVFERRSEFFKIDNPNIRIIDAELRGVNTSCRQLLLHNHEAIRYDRLCLCTGATPTPLLPPHPRVLALRDLESVHALGEKLGKASTRRVVVVGNGGIALELVHALQSLHLVWVVRDDFLGHAFFDASASAFISPALSSRLEKGEVLATTTATTTTAASTAAAAVAVGNDAALYRSEEGGKEGGRECGGGGGSVGPEWLKKSDFLRQVEGGRASQEGSLKVEHRQGVVAVRDVWGDLSSGPAVGAAGGAACWRAVMQYASALDSDSDSDHSSRGSTIGTDGYLSLQQREHAESLLHQHLASSSTALFPLYMLTSHDKIIGCDYIISAIGATANTSYLSPVLAATSAAGQEDDQGSLGVAVSPTGEVLVDEGMQVLATGDSGGVVEGVFAAGDCCQVCLQEERQTHERHWFQMKLWSQARSMGIYAAHCIARSVEMERHVRHDQPSSGQLRPADFESVFGNTLLDMFAHITHFFGRKMVLLGRFNAQGLGTRLQHCTRELVVTAEGLQFSNSSEKLATSFESRPQSIGDTVGGSSTVSGSQTAAEIASEPAVEIWTRVTPGVEYIKVTVLGGRVVGALLLGDTGLEEVMENLIMNAMDVSAYGVNLLSPDLDLEDFFD